MRDTKEFDMRAMLMGSVIGAMTLMAGVAQAEPTTRQEVQVPFAFTVNGQEMPAGSYTVRQDQDQPSALLIQGQGKRDAIYVLTAPVSNGSAPQDTSLVFTRTGNGYRLAQVWDEERGGVSIVDTK
jgi:hypothetical protein